MSLENYPISRRMLIKTTGVGIASLLLQPLFNLSVCEASAYTDKNTPLAIDKHKKTVHIYTEVNLKNIKKKNPHWGIVAKNGKLADKAILTSFCDAIDFHDALLSIGAKHGNNLTEDKTGIVVGGDVLDVSLFWEDTAKTYRLKDAFEDSTGKGFQIRFGGNKEAAKREKTGCITCLESCWIAITSNDRYPNISNLKRTLSPNSYFKGNEAVLPNKEGSPVIVKYTLLT